LGATSMGLASSIAASLAWLNATPSRVKPVSIKLNQIK
jgi:hypothetical protein